MNEIKKDALLSPDSFINQLKLLNCTDEFKTTACFLLTKYGTMDELVAAQKEMILQQETLLLIIMGIYERFNMNELTMDLKKASKLYDKKEVVIDDLLDDKGILNGKIKVRVEEINSVRDSLTNDQDLQSGN